RAGWFLYPFVRGCRRHSRCVFCFISFVCSSLLIPITLTRARGPGRGLPVATGSLANAIGRAKPAEGLGRAPLRHFGLDGSFIPRSEERRVGREWSFGLLVSAAQR